MNRKPPLDFLLSISSSKRIFISVPRGVGRKRAADLCGAGLRLFWDCAAGINKANQNTDTIKRAIMLENFRIVFSFLMISPLFVQRTIRREKLNKQIHWVKVDCAPKSNHARLAHYLNINRRRFTNSDAISIIAGHFVNA